MEYTGSALALEPIFASVVLSGRLLARCRGTAAAQWLDTIASGERIFAFAHAESTDEAMPRVVRTTWRDGRITGTKVVVLHGDIADGVIVTATRVDSGALAFCLVDPASPGVTATRYRFLDDRGAASFNFDNATTEPLDVDGVPAEVLDALLDDARLALCAETHGAVAALNAATNAYLKARIQFGRPIGDNHALQHRMVELWMLEQELSAAIGAAQRVIGASGRERTLAIAAAAAHAATVGRVVAHEAVQMHGGMGMTSELPVSHYFKRLMVTVRLLGHRDDHLARFVAHAEGAA